jgi:hypothetical protein
MLALLMLTLFAGCAEALLSVGDGPVVLGTDRSAYAAGDTARLALVNNSSAEVGFNLCRSRLERRSDGGWTHVEGAGLYCVDILLGLAPGKTATGVFPLPAELPGGEYRLVTHVSIDPREFAAPIATGVFMVR